MPASSHDAPSSLNSNAQPTLPVAYEWEYSVDGGKTWQPAPATLQAKTTVTGLALGTIGVSQRP